MVDDRYGQAVKIGDLHWPDEKRGGCMCGFCAWSPEHVAAMVAIDGWMPEVKKLNEIIVDLKAENEKLSSQPRWVKFEEPESDWYETEGNI